MLKGRQDVAGYTLSPDQRPWQLLSGDLVAAFPVLTLLPSAIGNGGATATQITSPRHCVVSNNRQTTDLIFCKKEKIIGHF